MGIRDEEIARLVNYLKGLNVKVTFSNAKNPETFAECSLDNSEIIVYTRNHYSKTELLLSLLHEAGHASHNIWKQNRQVDKKLEIALDKQNSSKKARKKIYQDEKAAIAYWDIVIRDVDIKLNPNRIEFQKEFDLWVYEYFWQNGDFPSRKVKREKTRELRSKWKT
jgi:hypothetical protein